MEVVSQTLRLREGQVLEGVPLSLEHARALGELAVARVAPESSRRWRLQVGSKVGSIRLGELDVRIEPKVPLARLFWMMSEGRRWGTWFDERVVADDSRDLLAVIAQVFSHFSERALSGGVLQGYRSREDAEPTIRGRWLVSEQLRKRQGLPLPAELQFDEYTRDIPENVLVRSACRRLLTLAGVDAAVRGSLQRIERALMDATLLTPGSSLPSVAFDRRNQHYRPAIELAFLILEEASVEHGTGDRRSSGYLIDVATVFESFLETMVSRSILRLGGIVKAQETSHLDSDGLVKIRPDLVWRRRGQPHAVFDAKYKAERPAGYPNADVYQMLAYCLRYGLPTGHLVYAAGNEQPARYEVVEAGVTVVCHALDLDLPPSGIAGAVDRIVDIAHRANQVHGPLSS